MVTIVPPFGTADLRRWPRRTERVLVVRHLRIQVSTRSLGKCTNFESGFCATIYAEALAMIPDSRQAEMMSEGVGA